MKRQLSLVLALVMILGSFSAVFAAEMPVTQVDKANFLKDVKVLEGNKDGDLNLEQDLKRRDAVVVLSRLFGKEDVAKAYPSEDLTFTDLTDPFYNGYVAWAVAEGYAKGKVEGVTFGLNDPLTAQHFSTFLLRALGYEVDAKADYDKALETAKELGLLTDLELEEKDTVTRGDMAAMTYNALGVVVKGGDKTLAETLDIVMPVEPKAEKLEAKVNTTENLAEVVVELSNVDLVKNMDALLNPANYRFSNGVTAKNVHLDGDNVILTLVPYGKVEDQGNFDTLIKNKKFNLTIRNIDNAINKSYNLVVPGDNEVPAVVENGVKFMGDYGIKVTTTEPIANPLERNFRIDTRTSMRVEQYGRDIILTPYHGKAFDKDAVELVIDELVDFAEYKSAKLTEEMKLSTDEDLPKVTKAYRSGKELVLEFDRDVYHDSIKSNVNRLTPGNVSFSERRVTFLAEKAEKIDTNVVKYTFTREIPRGIEVTVEGVANHFNKAMEKDVIVPDEYRDDYLPVIIDATKAVSITQAEDDLLPTTEAALKTLLDAGHEVDTKTMTIVFDKDIAQFKDMTKAEIEAKIGDYFTLYQLDITKRGENEAKDVKFTVESIEKDRIKLSFKDIKLNNKGRDFDYVLEVRNFSDLNGNRMERDYLDFQVVRVGTDFKVEIKDIKDARYANRDGMEIVLRFNDYVNKEEASNAKNYYINNELAVSEAIVERDGLTVSLVLYDKTKADYLRTNRILEISPRVEQLNWPYASVEERFWDLRTRKSITAPTASSSAIGYTHGSPAVSIDDTKVFNLDVSTNETINVILTGNPGDQVEARLVDSDNVTRNVQFGVIPALNTTASVPVVVPTTESAEFTLIVTGAQSSDLKVKVNETVVSGKVSYGGKDVVLQAAGTANPTKFIVPYNLDLTTLNEGSFNITVDGKATEVKSLTKYVYNATAKTASLVVTLKAENGTSVQYTIGVENAVVTGMTVKTAPTKVAYNLSATPAEDTLDLTGLVVTLTYSDTTTRDVALANFVAEGIATTPVNGFYPLTAANNQVAITHTASTQSVNQAITVTP